MKMSEAMARYIELRDNKAVLKKAHTAELREKFNDEMERLEAMFLRAFNKSGNTSVKAKGIGTAYLQPRVSDTVIDRTAYLGWVLETGNLEFLESRVSKAALDEWVEEHGELPPGVKRVVDQTVNIRRS